MKKYECKLNTENLQIISEWSGGRTRQLFIYPYNASGGTSFDYIFEITSSTMSDEETQYTVYKNYHRILMVIKDSTTLTHEDGRIVSLGQYSYDEFDGECLTFSKGCATDYELMIRKGNKGFIDVLSLNEDDEQNNLLCCHPNYPFAYHGFFCHQGNCRIQVGKEKFLLSESDQLSVIISGNAQVNAAYNGTCALINSVIYFA
jgi:environmental stress-induced protein Ves